jgi:type I restriction-modification system DNA methylase subunit
MKKSEHEEIINILEMLRHNLDNDNYSEYSYLFDIYSDLIDKLQWRKPKVSEQSRINRTKASFKAVSRPVVDIISDEEYKSITEASLLTGYTQETIIAHCKTLENVKIIKCRIIENDKNYQLLCKEKPILTVNKLNKQTRIFKYLEKK